MTPTKPAAAYPSIETLPHPQPSKAVTGVVQTTIAVSEKVLTHLQTAARRNGSRLLATHLNCASSESLEEYVVVEPDNETQGFQVSEFPEFPLPTNSDEALLSSLKVSAAAFFDIEEVKRCDISFICKVVAEVPGLYMCLEDAFKENEQVIASLLSAHPSFVTELPSAYTTDRALLGLLRRFPNLSSCLSSRFALDLPKDTPAIAISESDQFLEWYLWLHPESVPSSVDATRETIIKACSKLPLEDLRKSIAFAMRSRESFEVFCNLLQMDFADEPDVLSLAAGLKMLAPAPSSENPLQPLQKSIRQLKGLCGISCYPLSTLLLNIYYEYSLDQMYGESIPYQMRRLAAEHFRTHHAGKTSASQLVRAFMESVA